MAHLGGHAPPCSGPSWAVAAAAQAAWARLRGSAVKGGRWRPARMGAPLTARGAQAPETSARHGVATEPSRNWRNKIIAASARSPLS